MGVTREPLSNRGVSTRVCALLLSSALLLVMFPAEALGYYAYNYGIDWDQEPFNAANQDFWSCAYQAEVQQDAGGYTGLSYDEAWAEQVYNNMGASTMRLMSIVSHGDPGAVLLYDSPARTYGAYSTNISVVSSNINWTGLRVGIEGSETEQYVQSTSYVTNLNSPIKIIYYVGCETGADPPSGYNLLWASVGIAGMNFAGGFRGPITGVTSSGSNPQAFWQYKYWYSLRSDYGAGWSQMLAKNYVYLIYNDFEGYDSYYARGNNAELM